MLKVRSDIKRPIKKKMPDKVMIMSNILSDTPENVVSAQAFFNFCSFYLHYYLHYLYQYDFFKQRWLEMWQFHIPFICTAWVKS